MSDWRHLGMRIIDGLALERPLREVLRPAELVPDRQGRARRLPRFFYEVESWEAAKDIQLAPHFTMAEFIDVDVREHPLQRGFPRYVPCAVVVLAGALELFRQAVGAKVYVAANGGYRTPRHELSRYATPHTWGAAANLYRIGDTYLDKRDLIEKYNQLATGLSPAFRIRPFGPGVGEVDDHVHLDVGFLVEVPPEAPPESMGEPIPIEEEEPVE
ncbi:MAG TPA: hypothetical protein VF832_18455 [Longimicrobiales bacterium]